MGKTGISRAVRNKPKDQNASQQTDIHHIESIHDVNEKDDNTIYIKNTLQAVIWIKKAANGSDQWVKDCSEEQYGWYRLFKRTKLLNQIAKYALLALTLFEVPSVCKGTPYECAHANLYVYSWHFPVIPTRVRMALALFLYAFMAGRMYVRSLALGQKYVFSGWTAFTCVVLVVAIVTCIYTFFTGTEASLTYMITVMCRPLIYVGFTRKMKEAFSQIVRSLSSYADVMVSLFLSIFIFIWMGMVLFIRTPEGNVDFFSWGDGFAKMWILFTTSNDPDAWMPAYGTDKWSFIFFFVFLVLTLYLLSNLLLAKVYDAYKKILKADTEQVQKRRDEAIHHAWSCLTEEHRQAMETHRRPSVVAKIGITSRTWQEFFIEFCDPLIGGVSAGDLSSPSAVRHVLERANVILDNAGAHGMKYRIGKSGTTMHYTEFVFVMHTLLDHSMYIPKRRSPKADRWFCSLETLETLNKFFLEGAEIGGVPFQWDRMVDCVIFAGVFFTFWASWSFTQGGVIHDLKEAPSFWILFGFSCFYTLGVSTKIFSIGFERFWYRRPLQHRFDFFNIYALIIVELLFICTPWYTVALERTIIVLHMCRGLRLFRYVAPMKALFEIIVKLLPTFWQMTLVLFVVFYIFAIVGQYYFGGLIYTTNPALAGTNFASAYYYALNFNDLVSGMITLFALMVVNNWYELAQGYMLVTGTIWAASYFVIFFVVCNLIVVNILIALIIDCYSIADAEVKEANARTEAAPRRMSSKERLVQQGSLPLSPTATPIDLEQGEGLGELSAGATVRKLVGIEDHDQTISSSNDDEDVPEESSPSSDTEGKSSSSRGDAAVGAV